MSFCPWGGVSRPRREVEGSGRGGGVSRLIPREEVKGGVFRPRPRGVQAQAGDLSQHALRQTPPSRQLLLRTVASYWNAFLVRISFFFSTSHIIQAQTEGRFTLDVCVRGTIKVQHKDWGRECHSLRLRHPWCNVKWRWNWRKRWSQVRTNHYTRWPVSQVVIIFTPVCHSVYRGGTWAGTPPWDQLHPAGARYTPQDQVHPQGPGTPPWDQVHPPGTRYTPPRPGTPPSSACWEIRATSGQYASYWNAFLLILHAKLCQFLVSNLY